MRFLVSPHVCVATVAAVALLLLPLLGFGATLRVPQDFPTVRAAVFASLRGDVIVIAPGLYIVPGASDFRGIPVGLILHDGTTLQGSGPAQTVLDFAGASIGIMLQNGTATVRGLHLRNTAQHIFSYIGSNIIVENIIITDTVPGIPGCCVGVELNQGQSYVVHNTTIDKLNGDIPTVSGHAGTGIDVPFGGSVDIQNNIVTSSDHGILPSRGGILEFNDVFNSLIQNWGTAIPSPPLIPPPSNISADPLYCPNFTLQPGSPAIDAGSPSLFDPDGTRSDMGAYGGPRAILPPLVASPCVIDFGEVPVGVTSIPINVQVRSTIQETQTITGIFSTSSPFAVTNLPQLPLGVGAEGTATFGVTFSPSSLGEVTGDVQVITSNPFPTLVRVRGIGIEAQFLSIQSFFTDSDLNPIDSVDTVFVPGRDGVARLVATNPGTYIYHLRVDDVSDVQSISVTINIPDAINPNGSSVIALPLKGSNPIHVYDGDPRMLGTNEITDLAVVNPAQPLSTESTSADPITITSPMPGTDTVYITVHFDLALKGTSGYPPDSSTQFARGFKVRADISGQSIQFPSFTVPSVNTTLVAVGKKATAIGGFALDTAGAPKNGLTVEVSGEDFSGSSLTGVIAGDGFYLVNVPPASSGYTLKLKNGVGNTLKTATVPLVGLREFVKVDFTNLSPADPIIQGFVMDSDGRPVERAEVQLYSVRSGKLLGAKKSSPGGRYALRLYAPGSYRVVAILPTGEQSGRTVALSQFETLVLNFVF